MLLLEAYIPRSDLSSWKRSVAVLTWLLCWSTAQVSLAEGHKFDRDVELLIFYRKVHSPSVAVEMGMPEREAGIFFLTYKSPSKKEDTLP